MANVSLGVSSASATTTSYDPIGQAFASMGGKLVSKEDVTRLQNNIGGALTWLAERMTTPGGLPAGTVVSREFAEEVLQSLAYEEPQVAATAERIAAASAALRTLLPTLPSAADLGHPIAVAPRAPMSRAGQLGFTPQQMTQVLRNQDPRIGRASDSVVLDLLKNRAPRLTPSGVVAGDLRISLTGGSTAWECGVLDVLTRAKEMGVELDVNAQTLALWARGLSPEAIGALRQFAVAVGLGDAVPADGVDAPSAALADAQMNVARARRLEDQRAFAAMQARRQEGIFGVRETPKG